MALRAFRAVIFDCDGVLVESEVLGLRSLQLALREAGIDRPLTALTRFSGRSHHETLEELERESGLNLADSRVADRMDEHYADLVRAEGLPCPPGVVELLEWFGSCGIPFTLASSGPRRKVCFSLNNAGLLSWFQQFVCGDDVARAKPAPDPYLAAAALLGVAPQDCVAIEDAPNGVISARSAGMQVVGLTTTFAADALGAADMVVNSLPVLTEHMKQVWKIAG